MLCVTFSNLSRKSTLTAKQVEQILLNEIKKYTYPGQCYFAGNSVYQDKVFIAKEMPELAKYVHYRIVDVSTIKVLCENWYPNEYNKKPLKKGAHRALDDILESIQELKYYKSAIFKSNAK